MFVTKKPTHQITYQLFHPNNVRNALGSSSITSTMILWSKCFKVVSLRWQTEATAYSIIECNLRPSSFVMGRSCDM